MLLVEQASDFSAISVYSSVGVSLKPFGDWRYLLASAILYKFGKRL